MMRAIHFFFIYFDSVTQDNILYIFLALNLDLFVLFLQIGLFKKYLLQIFLMILLHLLQTSLFNLVNKF